MRINLKDLKLHPGKKERFASSEKGKPGLLLGPEDSFARDVQIEVEVENTGRDFLVSGTVSTVVNLHCARCLSAFPFAINTDFNITLTSSGNKSADEEIVYFTGDEVDISDFIDEALVLALPMIPLCKEECKGLCPVCGNNKNLSTCNCQQEFIDPRLEKLKYYK